MMNQNNGHIIFSYSFSEDGKAEKIVGDQIIEELKNQGLAWVHLDANHEKTAKWLQSEVSYLDHLIIDALMMEETRPRIVEFESGFLIILRGVNLNKNSEPEDMISIRMWIDEDRIISVQRQDLKAVFDIKDQIESGKAIKNSGEFLYNLLYQILLVTSPFLYDLTDKIDDLEEKIISSRDISLREEILQIRTQSTIFKRYLSPQKEVINRLNRIEYSWINDWAKRHFQENYDNITHMIDEINEARDRSKILHDELTNSLTEKLNKSMYRLSIITVIFMPLTFITGLFGINISGIPGAENQNAFYIFCFVMFLVGAIEVFLFKRKDWF
jgi:zinc transporter